MKQKKQKKPQFHSRKIGDRTMRPAVKALVGALAVVVALLVYFNVGFTQRYSVNIGTGDDDAIRNRLYIESQQIGGKQLDDDTSYRRLVKPQASLILQPRNIISSKQDVLLTARVRSDADLHVAVNCYQCDIDTTEYEKDEESFVKYNSVFYQTRLKEYKKIDSIGGATVYARNSFDPSSFESADTIEAWLETNAASASKTVDIVDLDIDVSQLRVQVDADHELYAYQPYTRGGARYIAYFNDRASMQIEKRDLNWYDDDDTVTITVSPVQDLNTKPYTTIIQDDGLPVDTEGDIQVATVEMEDIVPGLYYIDINGATDEVGNENNDFVIPSIVANTNAFMIGGDPIFAGSTRLYYSDPIEREISFYGWNEDQQQTILINDQDLLTIGSAELAQQQLATLPAGTHKLRTSASLRIDMKGAFYGLEGFSVFSTEALVIDKKDPDIIVSGIDVDFEKDSEWVSVTKRIPVASLFTRWKVDESTGQQQAKSVQFVLYSDDAKDGYETLRTISNQQYTHVYSEDDTHIFTRQQIDANDFITFDSYADVVQALVADGGVVGTHEYTPDPNFFLRTVDGKKTDTEITDDFYSGTTLYIKNVGGLNLKMTYQANKERSDEASIIIRDVLGKQMHKSVLPVNIVGESQEYEIFMTDDELPDSTYSIEFIGKDELYTVEDISLDAPRVTFDSAVSLAGPSQVTTVFENGGTVRFKIADSSQIQTIRIDDIDYALTELNIGNWTSIRLGEGEHTIITERGIELESDTYIAQQIDHYFDPYVYEFREWKNQETVIVNASVPEILLDAVQVVIQRRK